MYRTLVSIAVVVTFGLVMLGAYVRLTDAGLGCPDWPGCYGALTPHHAQESIAQAVDAQGGEHGPVSLGKAWREMVHRYIASALGLLIVVIAVIAVRHRKEPGYAPWLAVALVGVVILQGLFGKWTVTLLLKPVIVTGHLAGGMLVLSMLVWLWLRQQPPVRYVDPEPVAVLLWPARVGLLLVVLQLLLGGWTSTNYAALACQDLPTCHGQWWPQMNFADAFHVLRELGKTGEGAYLPMEALTAIHMSHRLGAIVVTLFVGWLGLRALSAPGAGGLGGALLAALALQIALGLSNVLFSLPLPVAVAHNGGAALLLSVLVVLNFRAFAASLRV